MKKYFIIGISFLLSVLFGVTALIPNGVVFAENVSTSDKASLIMDFYSGEIVYEQNADKHLQVASIVKLMTTLLTMEEIEKGTFTLSDKMVTTENSAGMGGSQVFIDPFVEYTVEDMLRSVIVASANDASVALAEYIAGSEENFVVKMNKRAKELGLKNTIYSNSTGLPAPEEHSTARDVATLLREVIKHDIYHKFSTVWMDELVHPSGRKTELVNTNKLTRYFKGCDGGKTGFTDEAGYCLSATAKRDNLRFIAVSLGAKDSKTRFANVSTLLNYAFANFENRQLVSADKAIGEVSLKMGKEEKVSVYAKEDYFALTKKGENYHHEVTVQLPQSVRAPLCKGDAVGKIIVTNEGKVIKEIELVLIDNYDKLNFKDAFGKVVSNW